MEKLERYHLYSVTPDYGVVPTFVTGRNLVNKVGFASLYSISKETADAIVQEGTTKGFKGIVWADRLWLDFDSYEDCEEAEVKIKEMGYDYVAYDTGGRGGHFGILRSHPPSHLLPSKDRQWVEENFPKADKSIYTHLHPFRLDGTPHQRTGGTKTLVARGGGSTLTLSPLKSKEVQTGKVYSQQGERSIFDCFRVIANTVPVENGERHGTMIRLIYGLKESANVDMDTALWWVLEWNKMLTEPKEESEIEKAIRSIYR